MCNFLAIRLARWYQYGQNDNIKNFHDVLSRSFELESEVRRASLPIDTVWWEIEVDQAVKIPRGCSNRRV